MLTSNPEYAGLIAAVKNNPQDDFARLILADWLDDNNFAERAEFIRHSIALDLLDKANSWRNRACRCDGGGTVCGACRDERDWKAGSEGAKRAVSMAFGGWLFRDGFQWAPPGWGHHHEHVTPKYPALIGILGEMTWHRGFVSLLRGPLESLLTRGPAIVAANPVERVEVLDWSISEASQLPVFEEVFSGIYKRMTDEKCNAAVLAELRRRAGEKSDTISTCHGTTSEHGLNRAG